MFKAFVHKVLPVSSDEENEHQSSPGWLLTFVRWKVRDTKRTKTADLLGTLPIMTVENDCIDCKVSVSKGSYTPSMAATLKITDINYNTAIAPGDFVSVNMNTFETDTRELVRKIAEGDVQLNDKNSGFKGLFKVQSVRESIGVDPQTGTKIVVVKVTGFAFTEFNNAIYFNPNLVAEANRNNLLLFVTDIAKFWPKMVNQQGTVNCQDLISLLIQGLIGPGVTGESKSLKVMGPPAPGSSASSELLVSPNTHFFVPLLIGKMLGIRSTVHAAKDIYNYLFGIQKYASGNTQALEDGMNPTGLRRGKGGHFLFTPTACEGRGYLKTDYWNNVKTWAILNQYTNAPLNELFNCFRVDVNGSIMPTMVFRQIPFTTEEYSGGGATTKFMNLPRWQIHPALVLNYDLGREEAARINFVQFFGGSVNDKNGTSFTQETAHQNYVYDVNDVKRNGLRPYIVSTQFDEVLKTDGKTASLRSPIWARILGDAMVGGHLKMNGSLLCHGIQDPVAVGDNLEFNNIVYHIEQIEHTCQMAGDKKVFRTLFALSNGVSVDSERGTQAYAEMNFPSAQADRENDYNNVDQILPGISEAQDTWTRRNSDVDTAKGASNVPFVQPNVKPIPKQKKKK